MTKNSLIILRDAAIGFVALVVFMLIAINASAAVSETILHSETTEHDIMRAL